MSKPLLKLAERIRNELVDLDRLVERTQEGWRRAQRANLAHRQKSSGQAPFSNQIEIVEGDSRSGVGLPFGQS